MNPPPDLNLPPRHIPYELLVLAAVLDEQGHEASILDADAGGYKNGQWSGHLSVQTIRDELGEEKGKWDPIIFGGRFGSYRWVKQIVPAVRHDYPDVLLLAGGEVASAAPSLMLRQIRDLDACIVADYEKVVPRIIAGRDRLAKRGTDGRRRPKTAVSKAWQGIRGIWYRKKGHLKSSGDPPRSTDAEFDDLPHPLWDLVPTEVYSANLPLPFLPQVSGTRHRVEVMASRPGGARHSPRYLFDLVRDARLKMGTDFVSFTGEDFLADSEWVHALCDLFIENNMPRLLSWGCNAKANNLDPAVYEKLRDAGCSHIVYDAGSADQRILDSTGTGTTVRMLYGAIRVTRGVHVTPVMNFKMNFVGEDLQAVYNTLKFCILNDIHCIPAFYLPKPGEALYEEYRDEIFGQCGGEEAYLDGLGNELALVANLTGFTDPELLGLRDIFVAQDEKRLLRFAQQKGIEIDREETEKRMAGSHAPLNLI